VQRKREARRESLESFAAHFGIGGAYVSGWEVHGRVPRRRVIERGVASLGEDPGPWLTAAGYDEHLGVTLGEPVAGADLTIDTGAPKVGSMSDSIVEFDAGHAPDQGAAMRYAVVVASGWAGGAFQTGDVLLFEQVDSAPRNARVIVREADGTCRLVRYIRTVSANEREMSVQLLDAPGLQKPVTVKAQIIARLIGMRTLDY